MTTPEPPPPRRRPDRRAAVLPALAGLASLVVVFGAIG